MAFGSSSTFRGGSGGGRSSYRGGSGRGRGRGRHSGGGGGGAGGGGSGQTATVLPCKFRPCKSWLQSGSCPNGSRCHYAHVVQLHAALEATAFVDDASGKPPSGFANGGGAAKPQQRAAVTSVALWETSGVLKIFTGSLDGSWRLWRTADWRAEFESAVGTRVESLLVHGNTHLVCGMEAGTRALPTCTVGMCHVWDLNQPDRAPMELQLDYAAGTGTTGANCLFPYAHNQAVTALCLEDTSLITGSRDGCIRVWRFDSASNPPAFVLDKTLFGHAREVTGLVVVGGTGTGGTTLLWSGGLDGSIRIWDLASGACRHSITSAPPMTAPPGSAAGPGHTDAVTALTRFQSPAGTFVLSASLDGTIKAWNGSTGECVASEPHGEGVISLAIGRDPSNTEVLLVGLESGNIVCRNLVQTPKTAAFAALFCLTTKFNQGHAEAVRCITAGPQATFYSGGADGKLMVWQINGDLQLN